MLIEAKVFPIFVWIMVPAGKFLIRTIGNQVEILDSTRCCNLLFFSGHTLPLFSDDHHHHDS
jgi:hypothetical protein